MESMSQRQHGVHNDAWYAYRKGGMVTHGCAWLNGSMHKSSSTYTVTHATATLKTMHDHGTLKNSEHHFALTNRVRCTGMIVFLPP